ncbi:hypothetical protein SAMN05720764_1048 [Fibrobacter sp. UWH5]|nr:hypothetical protein SAMN05720764_1048 [Fibrobacter sp. UWH5]
MEVIDNKIIYSIVKNSLSDFVEFAASIARL